MTNSRQELLLTGCSPTPMAAYLKALGVLRLVTEQADQNATGCWHYDAFVLHSRYREEELISWFLNGYEPSAIVDPWNGGSGFYPKDNQDAIRAIMNGEAARFGVYRESIQACRGVLDRMNIQSKVDTQTKPLLLEECRNSLPDEALDWLDAAFLLTEDGPKYPPLLGTGGNDGRLDFPNNFMQRLCELFDPETGQANDATESLLREALFEEPTHDLHSKGAVGQFDPGSAGGANAMVGFNGKTLLNPWDYVLMMEGAIAFASAAVKKLEARTSGSLAYPFCVRSAGVGYGSASEDDEQSARAEMWMPLWKSPATFSEIQALFAEGRVQVKRRPARNAVDFARALATFGVDRGISEFVRYGFHQRNGLAYFAVPLNRYIVQGQPEVNLVQTIDHWLDRFRRAANGKGAPSSSSRALRRMEATIMELCQRKGSERVQDLVVALGDAEGVLARSASFREDNSFKPLVLPMEWLPAMENNSIEFRLAAALAGIWDREIGAFREHLEPVEVKGLNVWWMKTKSTKAVWGGGGLLRNLTTVLHRRVVDAMGQGPIGVQDVVLFPGRSVYAVSLGDVQAFLEGRVDLTRLEALLKGMALLDWVEIRKNRADIPLQRGPYEPMPSAGYALLKLTHLPFPLARSKESFETAIRLTPAISRLAVAGNIAEATQAAARRLRGSGVPPMVESAIVPAENAERLVASLLLPLSPKDAGRLADRVMDAGQVAEDDPRNEPVEV